MPDLPTGTVTFLFTDIEGSTRLLQRLGPAYERLLADHHRIMREAIAAGGGAEVGTEGDSFFAAFPSAGTALASVVQAQLAMQAAAWPEGVAVAVRMGLHTGDGRVVNGGYVGIDVHRAARIAAAGHGGQVLLSSATATLAADALRDGLALHDLGEHRLKDLDREEHIFQLRAPGLRDEFPALKTAGAPRANLPAEMTTFVGREAELEAATRHLALNRLLTLTGPGGTGKTRLAIRIGSEVAGDFEDGVHFVGLATLRDPDLLTPHIIQALSVPQTVMPYPNVPTPLERLAEFLAPRHLLLILDNFEQLQGAAPIVATLLSAAPHLRVLVTSRSPLHISGEQEVHIPPLRVPDREEAHDLERARESDAVALFVDRARAVRPDFDLTDDNVGAVTELCIRLDGLPLAIELAAARIKLLSPDAMLARLSQILGMGAGARDVPDRQRTLRAAISWSHDLLDDRRALLFARMAVFTGGARLEAVESVASIEGGDLLDDLVSLVDESLVRRSDDPDAEPRFGMLETIHEFALERFETLDDREALRRRHAEYFLDVAIETLPRIYGQDRRLWLDRLERDHDNLRAAFAWSLGAGDTSLVLRLSAALWRFWQMRGHLDEGAERIDQALALPWSGDPVLRAAALEAMGGIEHWRGNQRASRRQYEAALAIHTARGDAAAIAEEHYNLSFTYFMSSEPEDVPRGRELAMESLATFEAMDDQAGIGRAKWALGNAIMFAGDLTESQRLQREALAVQRELGNTFMVTWILFSLGRASFGAGNYEMAGSAFAESLGMLAESEDRSGVVILLASLADLAWAQGDRDRALRLWGAMARQQRVTGAGIIVNMAKFGQEVDPDAILADPTLQASLAAGETMSADEAVEFALQVPTNPAVQ
ncbi:MAG: ATP-binding protein [Candidatus Limnocylindria bacterium]